MKLCKLCKEQEIEKGSWCKLCTKQYNKNYRQLNKKKLKRLNKKWRENNAEHYKKIKYSYYASKRGRIVELCKSAAKRAKEKGLDYTLSFEIVEAIWEKQNGCCALTKIEFQIPQERIGKASPFSPSIDRIDCSKGYTLNNVRLVCVAVNYALNEFGEAIFKQICEAYLSRKNP